ncbi:MAG: hypothetical protein RJQ04_19030 [Longimicrobiales bacterium]
MLRPDLHLATCRSLPDGDPDTRRLASHLRGQGLAVEVVVWDDPAVDWEAPGLTLIRSTWDYHERRDAFVRWVRSVPRLHNPAALVEWNTDKRYLIDLSATLPVVESELLVDPTPRRVAGRMDALGLDEAVLKPTFGLDGHGVMRVGRDGVGPLPGAWLLQPFVEEASREGETSVVVIDGHPSHAVLRRPPPDDFRAQERLGGRVEAVDPEPDVSALALRAVQTLDPVPLYARVDVVRRGGTPVIMELELVEPSLFFDHGPAGLDAMTRALQARL